MILVNKMDKIELGRWLCSTGRIRISDPCYDRGSNSSFSLAHIIDNATTGLWVAEIVIVNSGFSQGRIKYLLSHKDGISDEEIVTVTKNSFKCPVDSGQLGFFDDEFYKVDLELEEEFYDNCCVQTEGELKAGLVIFDEEDPIGVVSSSGWGDGYYDGTVCKNADGKVVQICVQFITPEWEETIKKIMIGNEEEEEEECHCCHGTLEEDDSSELSSHESD